MPERTVLLRVPVNELGLILSEEMERAAIDAAQEAHMAGMSDQHELLEGVLAALRAFPRVSEAAAEAEADSKRLDWLEAWILRSETDGHLFCYAAMTPDSSDQCNLEVDGETVGRNPSLRAAIDAAAGAARSPAAPPEHST